VTNNAFLIKIIPPEGYNVYRLHVSRVVALASLVGLVLLVAGALGVHAWQLRIAEEHIESLQAQTAAQRDRLLEIDRQANSLAGQLRDIQRQDAQIRRLLGVGAAPAGPPRTSHAALPPRAIPNGAVIQAQLARLSAASGCTSGSPGAC
jgi:cell division protein FtsB